MRGLPSNPNPTVHAVATMDVGLRTALSSLIVASAAPRMLAPGTGKDERAAVEFYTDHFAGAGVETVFLAPPPSVEIRVRRSGRLPWAPAVGTVEMLSFRSPYDVRNPALVDSYGRRRRNWIARAQHWRHGDEPRPTLIVVHGFAGSAYSFNSGFFSLPWFYGHGLDVMLVTLPFHGRRADRFDPYSGYGLFAHGLGFMAEAIMQAVCDLRVLVGFLIDQGVDRVGMTGLSLGGYMTAVMAAVEPRLHVAIPNAAVTDMADLMDSWFPASELLKVARRRFGVGDEMYRKFATFHSPLRFPAAIPHERLFVIGGLGDRLAPPEQSERLWEHWGRPKIHWYPGNHIVHFGRGEYLREMGRFLRDTDFSTGEIEPAAA